MFDSGADPIIDSSIYMNNGFIGIKINNPLYPLQVDGSAKVNSLYIEDSIRDTSNNILLGYGSPLQLGANTNFREVDIYTGNINPAIHVDVSNNVSFDQKLFNYLFSLINLSNSSSVLFSLSIFSPSGLSVKESNFSKLSSCLSLNSFEDKL